MKTKVERIDAVRRFSRFYTKQLGLLDDGLLQSPFTLPQARVIYELAHLGHASGSALAESLELDQGYMSRLVQGLEQLGLVEKRRSDEDGRRVLLSLSSEGMQEFSRLEARSREQIDAMLAELADPDQTRLVDAMLTIQGLIGAPSAPPVSAGRVLLRSHRPGDIGWVIQRHAEVYHALRAWDDTFEALVSDIGARFLRDFDPSCERAWIAEQDGERIGAVFLTRRSKTEGQLRMLIVEPSARGHGVGRRLVGECVSHARYVGYRKIVLFTSKGLDAARRLYEAEGFQLVAEKPRHAWGKDHIEQWWELEL